MTVFILALLTALQIQPYDLGDEYYLLLNTGDTTVSFSSFRLNEPERIVLEVGGTAVALATPAVGATVGRIERDDLGDKTRFVFHISPGSAYTILHRKNLLLIGFRQELFITDETIETTLAAIDTRLAEKKAAAEAERLAAEQAKLAAEVEAKRLADAKVAEEKRMAAAAPVEKTAPVPEKKVAVAVQPAVEGEDALVGSLVAQQTAEKTQRMVEAQRIEEQKKAQEDASRLAAEQARLAKAEEDRKLAEAKRIEAQRRADEQARLAKTAEERRRAEAEQKRLVEEKKLAEAKANEEKRLAAEAETKRIAEAKIAEEKIAEEKRLAVLKKAEEEKRLAEAKAAEEARLAVLKKAEEDKKLALAQTEPQKTEEPPVSPEDKMKSLKVVKLEPTRKITEEAPPLKVVTLAAKGKLKNLFFRKFPEFSRVTMEVTGELDYAFREVKGGYVIDIHNFEKIPGYLLHIIDTRAFNAEVQYIYPKKEGKIFKIYIKSEQNIAVRKSEEDGLIHFDFYVPTMQ